MPHLTQPVFIHSSLLLNYNCLEQLQASRSSENLSERLKTPSVTTVRAKLRYKHLLPLKLPVAGVNLSLLSLISISATSVGYVTEESAWKETAGDPLQWKPCVVEE